MAMKMTDRGTDALQAHLGTETTEMDVRQTRRGWLQELLGCEAKTEFNYFVGSTHVAHSLEDTDCFCRMCCAPIHPFQMRVNELNTESEILTVDRPCRCAAGLCKCCCYQTIDVTSGSHRLGSVTEDCAYCVPSFTVRGPDDQDIYKIHPPTCCAGCCYNCCSEGNGLGAICCKVPFRVYSAGLASTDGDAPYIGKILKQPKSLKTELFTDANAFKIDFPETATPEEKALLVGSSIFLNAIFFESNDQ